MPTSRLDAILGAAMQSFRQDQRSDAELLGRFLEQGDDNAFETLVVRHTPAVRAACRGWLRSASDIDDATQATFLVLVQRAGSIRARAALGRWLYSVAWNVARRLRRQQSATGPLPDDLPGRDEPAFDDVGELIHEEVARLPEKYRLPVQLCYCTGLSTAEAAQRLGWSRGTVLTRLAWARQRLQRSLTGRGVGPVAVAGALAATGATTVNAHWARLTAQAARCLWAGESPARLGVSARTITLTPGVARAMFYDRLKYVALAALLVAGLGGFGLGHWASASGEAAADRRSKPEVEPRRGHEQPLAAREREAADGAEAAADKDSDKPSEPRRGASGRRREAVIRVPVGTFSKEVDAAPYGSGRLTWTYEEDRVVGLIEGSVMGCEFEMALEAEFSLSSNGTIYGLLTSAHLNHLRLGGGGELEEALGELKPFVGLWPLLEPLLNDVLIDLPFSYQFRVQGDRLTITSFRILLAGPNPLGKVGGLVSGSELAVLSYFQALGTALEGTYTAEGKDKPAPAKRSMFLKPRGPARAKKAH